jgi:hypothetical protein
LSSKNGLLINVGTATDKIDAGRNAVVSYFLALQHFTEASDAEHVDMHVDTERAAQHGLLHVGEPVNNPSGVGTLRTQVIRAKFKHQSRNINQLYWIYFSLAEALLLPTFRGFLGASFLQSHCPWAVSMWRGIIDSNSAKLSTGFARSLSKEGILVQLLGEWGHKI